MKKIIKIDSPARIHLGFINLKEKSERIYGSLGLAINKFRNIQKIESNKNFEIVTKNKEIRKRVEAIFKTFLSLYKLISHNKKMHATGFLNFLVKKKNLIKTVVIDKGWYEFDDYEDLINYKKNYY